MKPKPTSTPILVLDFDGVIVDSTEECAVVAWNAWLKHNQWPGGVRSPGEIPDALLDRFRRLRNYVKTAGEYLVVFESEKDDVPVESQSDYDRLIAEADGVDEFAGLVFSERESLRRREPGHWAGLHTIYEGVGEQLKKVWDRFDVYVVTGKDKETVLSFYGTLGLPLREDHVFDKDAGKHKLRAVKALAAGRGAPLSMVVFVDDNVVHLMPLKRAGCHVLMAAWGYHTDEHLEVAARENIKKVSIPGLADELMALAAPNRRALKRRGDR